MLHTKIVYDLMTNRPNTDSFRYQDTPNTHNSSNAKSTQSPGTDIDVMAIGESMLAVRPNLEDEAFEWEVCGAESNVVRNCSALGLRTAWISQVGTDLAGDLVLSSIKNSGVDIGKVRRLPDHQTGLMLKEVIEHKRRVRYYRRNSAAAAMTPEIAAAISQNPKILHLTGITLGLSSTCRQLVESLINNGSTQTRMSFDINWRPTIWNSSNASTVLRQAANKCDIVFVGLDEATDLWSATSITDIRKLLPNPNVLVVKDGGNGAYADLLGQSWFVPALNGPVVEPVGAGDAFAAGFLCGTLTDQDNIEKCLRLGHITAMSALAQCSDVGPLADARTTRFLLEMSPQQWRTAHLDLAYPQPGLTIKNQQYSVS